MVGGVSTKLDENFHFLSETRSQQHSGTVKASRKDIKAFVEEYKEGHVFQFSQGRSMQAFRHFKYPLCTVKKLGKLKSRLQNYSKLHDDLQESAVWPFVILQ